ncbi:FecR family protein [Granulicella arctica]|uniref:FecR family protein n=1 Tax=Granulicella arctica TaxID=940613 RepID=UPI0021DF8A15|nr:FecR family protein [Granulicella arctica]
MKNIQSIAKWFVSGMTGFCLIAAGGAFAHADVTPTARIVRLTYTEGYVRVDRHDASAGDPAQLNMPLIEGQSIVTGEDGQAEVEFEDGSVARVTPNSTVTLTHLSVDQGGNFNTQIGLAKGLAYFELRSAPKFAYSVDAGGDIISPAENTTLRVNLDEAPAAIAVLTGAAHVEHANGYKVDVPLGETFRGDISHEGQYFLTQEIAADTWDQWNESRDQIAADAAPKQTAERNGYAGSQGYGWSDLDANGSWFDVPGQGQVWQPNGGDAEDFDPYGNGSWMWYPGGGYLWASSYSWGWTPFRCGGWSYWDTFGWGWSPNSGCGGFGFAGYGGYGYGGGYGGYGGRGGYLNVILPPRRYPIHHPPGSGGTGNGPHPILTVHNGWNGSGGTRPVGQQPGFRHIAGVVATPVRPIGQSYTFRGGSVVGASLTRDFPVDRQTHTPVIGVQPARQGVQNGFVNSSNPTTVRQGGSQPGFRNGPQQGGLQPGFRSNPQQGVVQQGMRPVPQQGFRPSGQPTQGNFTRPTGGSGVQSSAPHYSAPAQSAPHYSAPAQSFSAPASHSSPAPSSSGGGGKK